MGVRQFRILKWFEGIAVSGVEKTRKPFPDFYQILLNRYKIDPAKAVFIDDSHKNILGGEALGIKGIHFQSPEQLQSELTKNGIAF